MYFRNDIQKYKELNEESSDDSEDDDDNEEETDVMDWVFHQYRK